MAPIVHGLDQKYRGRIDFVYLDVRDSANAPAKSRFGFTTTPHFFATTADGKVLRDSSGVLEAEELERWMALLEQSITPTGR